MTRDQARRVLDAARAGLPVSGQAITAALVASGDLSSARSAFGVLPQQPITWRMRARAARTPTTGGAQR